MYVRDINKVRFEAQTSAAVAAVVVAGAGDNREKMLVNQRLLIKVLSMLFNILN
ncbi:unnamed protein product [Onchocerca flexuosa]|uniref:Variable large protein n=1 Tax=Onchocerca flexuosa TaxID=387005 RepID=A0A183HK78_9BILA|nr:unnamed protein product [Onchocerca flexuosa]